MEARIPWNPDAPYPAKRAGYVVCDGCLCWRPLDQTQPAESFTLCKDLELCKRLEASHKELGLRSPALP